MKEEPFGPIVPILTFKDFDEVIIEHNNDLGLASYVYTTDLEKANKASEISRQVVWLLTLILAVAEAPLV